MTATPQPADLRPFEPVSDALVLAALDRAERHSPHGRDGGVSWNTLLAHLGFVHTAGTTRKLRPQADALIADGLVETAKRNGMPVLRLTRKGRARLARARRTRTALDLPEAPQHRLWRKRRAAAGAYIDSARNQLASTLDEASRLFAEGGGDSDAWFALGERLRAHAHKFASATYQRNEWPEPDDTRPDLDEDMLGGDPRIGRRSVLRVREAAK
jgi:hypothetical protein